MAVYRGCVESENGIRDGVYVACNLREAGAQLWDKREGLLL